MRSRATTKEQSGRRRSRFERRVEAPVDNLGQGQRSPKKESVPPPPLSLRGLKESVYSVWSAIAQIEIEDDIFVESSPTKDKEFKRQMHHQYGDLRKKQTWRDAFASLWAKFFILTNDSNVELIRSFVKSSVPGWEALAPSVLDAFLYNYSQAIVCLRNGINRIMNLPDHQSLLVSFLNVLQQTRAFREQQFQFPPLYLPAVA